MIITVNLLLKTEHKIYDSLYANNVHKTEQEHPLAIQYWQPLAIASVKKKLKDYFKCNLFINFFHVYCAQHTDFDL